MTDYHFPTNIPSTLYYFLIFRITCLYYQTIHPPNMQFIHSSVICQTRGPQPLPKRFLHLMRSRASSFKLEYPLLSPRSSSNFLRLLPRLRVTSISPIIFPSITSFRRQFLRKMWPIQLAFRFLISCRIFLCSQTLSKCVYISIIFMDFILQKYCI
jgi:hypothetical protein